MQTLIIQQDVEPPVETREQLLPFERLAWENFERLNLRLARARGQVRHAVDHVPADSPRRTMSQHQAVAAGLYGTRGQDQEGIDLYVRLPQEEWSPDGTRCYLSLQSRRIAKLTGAKLLKAVTDFLEGDWAVVTRVFVYAVSLSGVDRDFADEVRTQRERLTALGIGFEVWDAEELSAQLKDQPRVVDDFFGRNWVDRFCVPHANNTLGERLDAGQVAALRTRLREFYTAFFEVTDSGMTALQRSDAPRVPFTERFVVPDVLAPVAATTDVPVAVASAPIVAPRHWHEQSQLLETIGTSTEPWERSPSPPLPAQRVVGSSTGWSAALAADFTARTDVDAWLASAERHLLVGGPGSGKSTFLRFALLDLLSDRPILDGWTTRFGGRLPVWLPFHFFTRRRAYGDHRASVSSTLKAWLEHNDAADLWDLVSKALEDQRLLLIVDGLDEWESEASARSAVIALETFLDQRGLPALVSTRPYGLARVGLSGVWNKAELAPLSLEQQHMLAGIWFGAAHASDGEQMALGENYPSVAGRHSVPVVDQVVEEFTRDVQGGAELRELAQVPLFLLLLIGLRLSGIRLPHRRFDVYDRVVEQLLRDHPAQRASAASQAQERNGLSSAEVRAVLAQVAFTHQSRGDFGPIPQQRVRQDVIEALRNPLYCAKDASTAAAASEQFIEIAEGELGVLVRQGHQELGFFHRALMEQLAAEYVVDYAGSDQVPGLIAERAGDPRWSEVLLTMAWRLRPHEISRAVLALAQTAVPESPAGMVAAELLAEIAFGDFRLPVPTARAHAQDILEIIDSHPYIPLRQRLLKIALAGLEQPAVADLLHDRLERWTVCYQPLPPAVFAQLGHADGDHSPDGRLWPVLAAALRDEDPQAVHAAARALVDRHAMGPHRDEARDLLLAAAAKAPTAQHGAVVLRHLALGWPHDDRVVASIAHARGQRPSEPKLVGIGAALGVLCGGATTNQPLQARLVGLSALTAQERQWLVGQLDTGDASNDLWRDLLTDALLAAIAEDEQARASVQRSCLDILRMGGPRMGDRYLAWQVLLCGFGHDQLTVDYMCTMLRTEHYAPSMWGERLFGQIYAGHEQVAEAVEGMLTARDRPPLDQWLPSLAAIDQGPVMRRTLLKQLTTSSTPQWAVAALCAHWLHDVEVTDTLRTSLGTATSTASWVARAAVPVLGPREALELLLPLLDPPADGRDHRPDIVTIAIMDACDELAITRGPEADRIAAACLGALDRFKHPWLSEGADQEVIVRLPASVPARQRTTDLLKTPQPPLTAILYSYRHDPAVIEAVLDTLHAVHPALPTPARITLTALLRDAATSSATIRGLTRHWVLESNDLARSSASAAHHTHLARDHQRGTLPESEWCTALDSLRLHAATTGFMNWGRQRAAWIGVLLTEQLHILDNLTDFRGDPLKVTLGSFGHKADLQLLNEIARQWEPLRARFGGSPVSRLTVDMESDISNVWAYLALVADRAPALASDLAQAVTADPSLLNRGTVLAWHASAHYGQAGLLDTLCQVTDADHTSWRPMADLLLADYWALGLDPQAVRERLHARLPQPPWHDSLPSQSSALEALADAFPEDDEVRRYWAMLADMRSRGEPLDMAPATYFSLVYAAAPVADLLSHIAHDGVFLEKLRGNFDRQFTRAVMRRLRRDEQARDSLAAHIEAATTSDTEAAQLASLLAGATPLNETTAESLASRLRRQAHLPDATHDYVSGETLPVPLLMLGILDASQQRK
ncbi:NACHT domain-containing protein [Streptomyces sp. NPDC051976]|uniref:NACHT domain-containing protein n=1 Tax=Streptomyces sp. NPDC051976 TaxID=3154947 RepID=UPI00342BEB87